MHSSLILLCLSIFIQFTESSYADSFQNSFQEIIHTHLTNARKFLEEKNNLRKKNYFSKELPFSLAVTRSKTKIDSTDDEKNQQTLEYWIEKESDKKIKSIPDSLYNQILLDLPRDKTEIFFDKTSIIDVSSKLFSNNEELVEVLYHLIITSLKKQKGFLDEERYQHMTHLILASRTQTFDSDAMNFVVNDLLKNHIEDAKNMVSIKAYGRNHKIEFNQPLEKQASIAHATTEMYLILGNVLATDPRGSKIFACLRVTREMSFFIDLERFSDEKILFEKISNNSCHKISKLANDYF